MLNGPILSLQREKLLDQRGSTTTTPPGLQISLRPGVTLTFDLLQWCNNCPCKPCNAGGPRGLDGPCANPQFFFTTLVVGYASSCLWTQHNLLRIVRSLGGLRLWPCFAAFAGGPEFVVTPLTSWPPKSTVSCPCSVDHLHNF